MRTAIGQPSDILLGPRDPARYGDWLQGPRGNRIYPFDVRPGDLDIRDVARSLSREPRWCGFTREPYYVGQHAWLVSMYCEPEDALWALVHDLPEFVGRDIPAPVKHMPEMSGHRDLEGGIMRAACDWLGLPMDMPASVKRFDRILGATEARDLFDVLDPEWAERLRAAETLEERIEPWGCYKAEWMFLDRFRELTGGRFA